MCAMQNGALLLRHTGRQTSAWTAKYASTSRVTLDLQRRHASFNFNPLKWLQRRAMPASREAAPKEEVEAIKQKQIEEGTGSVFEALAHEEEQKEKTAKTKKEKVVHADARSQTALFKISRRKLNDLGRQISGKPIDAAILQMAFSEKRASDRIKNMLATAKMSAIQRGLKPERLVVSEAWVNKGITIKRMEFKGRAKHGIREHPHSRLKVVLREGKTVEEKHKEASDRKLRKIVSAGLVRENIPIRNPAAGWAW